MVKVFGRKRAQTKTARPGDRFQMCWGVNQIFPGDADSPAKIGPDLSRAVEEGRGIVNRRLITVTYHHGFQSLLYLVDFKRSQTGVDFVGSDDRFQRGTGASAGGLPKNKLEMLVSVEV